MIKVTDLRKLCLDPYQLTRSLFQRTPAIATGLCGSVHVTLDFVAAIRFAHRNKALANALRGLLQTGAQPLKESPRKHHPEKIRASLRWNGYLFVL
jgi:hypothetical protein